MMYVTMHTIVFFEKCGIPEVVTVASDSGMMGGNVSHEYMLLTPVGEDSIVLCTSCDYRANMEAAENKVTNESKGNLEELHCVETPNCKTIDEVCAFLKSGVKSSCKAVVYQKNADDSFVVAFVRGDYEVNETKLRNLVGEDIHPAEITADDPLVAGYIGPYGISDQVTVYCDISLKGIDSMVAGANKEGYHYTGTEVSWKEIWEKLHTMIFPRYRKEAHVLAVPWKYHSMQLLPDLFPDSVLYNGILLCLHLLPCCQFP